MKKQIALILLAAFTATAQIQFIDITTPHTNNMTTSAQLNVPSKGWTNVPYMTTNYVYITFGDGTATAYAKINSDFNYVSNQIWRALQLPNQINTNLGAQINTQSNRINAVIATNNIQNGLLASFPGGNIQNGTVNSNALDSATLGWLQSIAMATMNFDSAAITSDGSGNITAVSIKANLLDQYSGTGSSGYFPRANGDGTFNWTAWPTTLDYDSSAITSDGSGNVAGTSWRGGLLDNGYSSGTAGYAPVANGDGTWTWGVVAGGGTMNYDSGNITSDGSGNITAIGLKSSLLDNGTSSGLGGYVPTANGDGTWTWGVASGSATVSVTNAVTGSPGTSVIVTNLGSSVAAVFRFTIPRGSDGTNTVTVQNFTNTWLGSRQYIVFSTNNVTWSTSNYLGRFSQVEDWTLNGGDDGGNPPQTKFIQLFGSYTGTNAWFVLTNNFMTTNTISLAATGDGGGLGNFVLYGVDKPELMGRTNYGFGQFYKFGRPRYGDDAATKDYVDTSVANIRDGNFTSYTDTNNVFHFIYSKNNLTVFDMTSIARFAHIESAGLDGTGTNIALTAYATNVTAGFTLRSSTNLALTAGFLPFTNYTTNTVSGLMTFTIPINFSEPQRFFRLQTSSSSSAAFYVPLALNGGALFPSNTWSIATITNGMRAGDIITVNSNGLKLVDVWMSNAVPVLKPHW